MQLAHFSDLHLPIHERPALTSLLNKRVLGYQSWRRKRHKRHQQWALDLLVADAHACGAEGFVISGDVTNIALPSEFADAAHWFDAQLKGVPAALVPGNHDSYVHVPWTLGMGRLARYMTGWPGAKGLCQSAPTAPASAQDFPFVSTLGQAQGLCIVCANSAPPTAPWLASGRLGARQIDVMASQLKAAAQSGAFRLVMLHHPVTAGVVSWRKTLEDAPAFAAMIKAVGADLILHGHTHFPVATTLPGPRGPIPVIGGGSASHAAAHGKYTAARYNLLDISRTQDGQWRTHITARVLDLEAKSVRTQNAGLAQELAA